MDKQKQIEEMARIFIKASCKGSECEKCLFIDSVKEAEECCVCLKAFYNAGYCKIPENAVVLTREEYEWLTCCFGKFEEIMNDIKKLVRKETAEKISDKVHRKMEPYMQPHTLYSQAEKELFQVFLNKLDEICEEIIREKK